MSLDSIKYSIIQEFDVRNCCLASYEVVTFLNMPKHARACEGHLTIASCLKFEGTSKSSPAVCSSVTLSRR